MRKILMNAAQCTKCGTTLISATTHDYQRCQCGAIAIDGGKEYLRRLGNDEDIRELSKMEGE